MYPNSLFITLLIKVNTANYFFKSLMSVYEKYMNKKSAFKKLDERQLKTEELRKKECKEG